MSRKKVNISKLDLSKIGGRIAYIRLTKSLSQEAFGKIIGVSKGNVSCFENHKYEPSFKILVQILERFAVDTDWLLKGKRDLESHSPQYDIDGNVLNGSNPKDRRPPHSVIVSRFQQKDLAWQINWDLIKLEQVDPNELKEIHDFINYRLSRAERRVGERRLEDDPDAIPSGRDRRQYQDRRKVGT